MLTETLDIISSSEIDVESLSAAEDIAGACCCCCCDPIFLAKPA